MNTFTYELMRIVFPRAVREIENSFLDYEDAITEWQDYTEQLKDQIRQYTPTIVDYKIAKKIVPSVKLGKVNQDNSKGRKIERNSYAMVLPGMPAIAEDYDPIMDQDGIISFEKRAVVEPVNPAPAANGSKAEDSKVDNNSHKNGSKPSDDTGLFEASSDFLKLTDMIAFWELKDMIAKDRKIKNGKLPDDQFKWLKEKYPAWQKNPASNEDYKKRFDGKFPK